MHAWQRCLLESGTMSLMSSLKVLYPPTRASSPKAGPSWTRFVLSHAAPLLCEQFVAGTSRQIRKRPSPITVADMSDMHDPTELVACTPTSLPNYSPVFLSRDHPFFRCQGIGGGAGGGHHIECDYIALCGAACVPRWPAGCCSPVLNGNVVDDEIHSFLCPRRPSLHRVERNDRL